VVLASADVESALADGGVSGEDAPFAAGAELETPSCSEALTACVLEGASAVDVASPAAAPLFEPKT
jgi:hypothetical protein